MTSLLRALYAELLKTRRTLALTLVFITPVAIVILSVLNFLRASTFFFGEGVSAWEWLIRNIFGLWALLLLPLFIALQAALLANLEHQNGGWKHLFALSETRWSIYVAKEIIVLLMIGLSHLVLIVGIVVAGSVLQLTNSRSEIVFGTVPWDKLLLSATVVYMSSWLLVVVHSWIALRWRQFTLTIGVAITAVVAGFMAANTQQGFFFPWSMPILSIASVFDNQGEGLGMMLLLNVVGLLVITPLACWNVVQRDVT